MRTTVWVLMTVVIFGLLIGLQYRRLHNVPVDLESLGYFQFDEPVTLTDVPLLDRDGRQVGLKSFSGRWLVLFFGFTRCPDVCPTTMSVLNLALGDLEGGPQVVMVSVDVDGDAPALVDEYVKAFNPSFAGFGGSSEAIRTLTDQMHIAFERVETDTGYTIEHSGALVVVDPQGRHRGYIRPPLRPAGIRDIAAAVMME